MHVLSHILAGMAPDRVLCCVVLGGTGRFVSSMERKDGLVCGRGFKLLVSFFIFRKCISILSILTDEPLTVSCLLCRNPKARAVLSADVKLKVLSPLWSIHLTLEEVAAY